MNDREYEEAFSRLRRRFPHETKKRLLREFQHALADSEHYDDVCDNSLRHRLVAVSCDRTRNVDFSYHYFDFFLGALSYLHGGSPSPRKPINQNRVIVWRNRRSTLLKILLFIRSQYGASHEVRFSRAIVLPYPDPEVGHRLFR